MPLFELLVWPGVVLALALLFRRPLIELAMRAQKAKVVGQEFVFKDAEEKLELIQDRQFGANVGPTFSKIDRVGDAFWLGHDFFWTYSFLKTHADRESIVRGFKQILHHLQRLEPQNKEFVLQVEKLQNQYLGGQLSPEDTEGLAEELNRIIYRVGASVEAHQEDFVSFAENLNENSSDS